MIATRRLQLETAVVTAALLLLLLLVAMAVRLSGYLEEAAVGRLDPAILGRLIALRVPDFLLLLLPLAFYAALLLTLARWRGDGELIVLYAAGLSPLWLLRSALLAALPWCLLLGALAHEGVPASRAALAELMAQQRGVLALGHLEPGRFQALGSERVAWVRHVAGDGGRFEEVLLLQRDAGGSSLVTARRGSLERSAATGARRLVLEEGFRHRVDDIRGPPDSTEFRRLLQRIDPEARTDTAADTLRTRNLWPGAEAWRGTELHWRLVLSVLPAVLVLPALLLFGRPGNAVPWHRFLVAAAVLLGLLLLLVAARSVAAGGRLSPALLLWSPMLVLVFSALPLWLRSGPRGHA